MNNSFNAAGRQIPEIAKCLLRPPKCIIGNVSYMVDVKGFNRRLIAGIAKRFYLAISVVCLAVSSPADWFDSAYLLGRV